MTEVGVSTTPMDPGAWNLQSFRRFVLALPEGDLGRDDLLVDEFLIGRDGKASVFYAPVDSTTLRADVVLVGLTPGWTQMRLAFEACREALAKGRSDAAASRAVKATAPFAGMRPRICSWLDQLGVHTWLDLTSTSSLFGDAKRQLHATSLIRYPVFIGDDYVNYRGTSPRPDQNALLRKVMEARLVPELAKFSAR